MDLAQIADVVLIVGACVIAIPCVILFVQCAASLWHRPKALYDASAPRPRAAVLVPAHDEEAVIEETLSRLVPQLQPGDRLLVVADNCSDDTAGLAERAGAEVVERQDSEQRGKGFALAFGVQQLADAAPDVLVVVDADCEVPEGSLDTLVRQAQASDRPVQALYLMRPPPDPSGRDLVSALAFAVKNCTRPAGMSVLGLPCHMTGTGMALPWRLLQTVSLATGNIVEDMQMGLDLAIAGAPPLYCELVTVYGRLPGQGAAAGSQRTRWEQGHLRTILTQMPRLMTTGLARGKPALLGLGLDLTVPPLSLLALLVGVAVAVSVCAGLCGQPWTAAWIAAADAAAFTLAVLAGWWRGARTFIPLRSLLRVPAYILWKIPIYLGFLFRPEKKWVRTDRNT